MKALLVILVIVAAIVLGNNYAQTGKIGFNVSLSEEEKDLRDLESRLDDAVQGYRIAGRGTSIGGLAPDSSAEHAATEVRRIERELVSLRERANSEEVKAAVRDLEAKVRAAKEEIGIP